MGRWRRAMPPRGSRGVKSAPTADRPSELRQRGAGGAEVSEQIVSYRADRECTPAELDSGGPAANQEAKPKRISDFRKRGDIALRGDVASRRRTLTGGFIGSSPTQAPRAARCST